MQSEYPEPVPDGHARTLAAELLERVALDASGAPFNPLNAETWQAEDDAMPELIRAGPVRLRVVDPDASGLATAVGAIEPGETRVCIIVEFHMGDGEPQPVMGQFIAIQTDEPGVSLAFAIWLSHWDINDAAAPDFGDGAVRNPALDAIGVNQGLLVQLLNDEAAP
jgi:hypothetical protein